MHTRRHIFLLVLASLLLGIHAESMAQLQPFLLMEVPGTKHRKRYYVGDEIAFRPQEQKEFNSGIIVALSDTSFFVNQRTEVPVKDVVSVIDRSRVHAIHAVGRGALYTIPTFFLFSAANNAFNTGRTPLIDQEVYYLAGAFAIIGGSFLLYKGKKYNTKGRWRLIVVNH